VVLPARWRVDGGVLLAAVPMETLALADAGPDAAVALTIDETSEWRARDMVGAMVQGTGSVYAMGRVETGERSLKTAVRAIDPNADALVGSAEPGP
jgi:hypothetical protein